MEIKNKLIQIHLILKGVLHTKIVPIHLKDGRVIMGKRWVADEKMNMPEKATMESLKEAKKIPKVDREEIIRNQYGGIVLNEDQYLNHLSSSLGIYKDESNKFHVKLNKGDDREAHNLWFLMTYLNGGLDKLNKVGEGEDFEYNDYTPHDIKLVKTPKNENSIRDSKLAEFLEDNYFDYACKIDRNTFAVLSESSVINLNKEELSNSKKVFETLPESKCKKVLEHWEDIADITELNFSTKLKLERYNRRGVGNAKSILNHLVNTNQIGFLDKQGIVSKFKDELDMENETPSVSYTLSPDDFEYKGGEANSISLLLTEKLNGFLQKEKNPEEFLKNILKQSSKFKMSSEDYNKVKNLFIKKYIETKLSAGAKPDKAQEYAKYYADSRYKHDVDDFNKMFSYRGYEYNSNSVSIPDSDDIDSYKKDIKSLSTEVNPEELKKKLQKELMTTRDKNRVSEIKEALARLK